MERNAKKDDFSNEDLGRLLECSKVSAAILCHTQRIVQVIEHTNQALGDGEDGGHSVGCRVLPLLACYPLEESLDEETLKKMKENHEPPLSYFLPSTFALHAILDFTLCCSIVFMARKIYDRIHDDFSRELKNVAEIFKKTVRSSTFYEGSNLHESIM